MAIRKNLILLITVFLIFAFFRFYNLNQRLSFDWDQEYYSYQVRKIIDGKLTLIGPRVNNDKGFFLGPYFFYLLVPFYFFGGLHPRGLLYYVFFYNFLFFFISFYVLKKIFGFHKSIFFLLFWSINPMLVVFDVTPWNVNWAIFGILIVIFLLKKIYINHKRIHLGYFMLFGFTLGFFLNFHPQFIFMILFCILFLFFIFKKKLFLFVKNTIILLGGLFFSFLPILIFDLRHNFLNSRLFLEFFFGEKTSALDRNVWFTVFINAFNPILIIKEKIFGVLFYSLILLFLIVLIKKNKNSFQNLFFQSFLGIWLIFPLFFSFLGSRPSEYYFYFLYLFIFLVIIEILFLIKKKFILIICLSFLFLINFKSLKNIIKAYDYGLYYKDKSIRKLKELVEQSKKFNISYNTPLGLNNGFSYLIDFYKIKQSGNFSDPLIEIRIPPGEDDIKINKIGLKIPKELIKK